MGVKEITSKSILTPSNLPNADYVINPYTGCSFGCTYCYASFMGRYVGKSNSDWGNYVYVKTNAPELLEKDIKKLKNKGRGKTIFSVQLQIHIKAWRRNINSPANVLRYYSTSDLKAN